MTAALLILYCALTLVAILSMPRGRGFFLHPGVLFASLSTLHFLGTVASVDSNNSVDREYLVVLFTAHLYFVLGLLIASLSFPVGKALARHWYWRQLHVDTGRRMNRLVLAITVPSIIICVLYYWAVGYNLFLESAVSVLTGNGLIKEVATRRLAAYSGEEYFAPGYVNQFKNILLPLMLLFLVGRYVLLKKRRDLVIALVLVPLCVVFLLGTGQRFYMFFTSIIAIVFFFAVFPKRVSRVFSVALVTLAIFFLVVGTLFLGRTVSDVSSSRALVDAASEAMDRVTMTEASGGLIGFRLIHDREPSWGGDWGGKLIRMLPGGKRGLSIDNEIHQFVHGSARGTIQLNVWAESWYNFRMLGATLVPFLLGAIYHAVFYRCMKGPKTLFRILIFAALSIILGTWQFGGPDYLINQGLPTVLFLYALYMGLTPFRRMIGERQVTLRGTATALGRGAAGAPEVTP